MKNTYKIYFEFHNIWNRKMKGVTWHFVLFHVDINLHETKSSLSISLKRLTRQLQIALILFNFGMSVCVDKVRK